MKLRANDYRPKEIVKILREWTGLTQKQFGETIYRTERSVRSLESGERRLSLETLLLIANKHNIKIIITKEK